MFGARTAVSTVATPAACRMARNCSVNLLSRPRMRNRLSGRKQSIGSMRFRATWAMNWGVRVLG
jgi:hypothetical protein